MIIVRFKMQVISKNRNEVLNAVKSISQEIKEEDGCMDIFVFQNHNDEDELIMIEAWKSRALLKKHWKTLNFSALLGAQKLLIQPPDVEIYSVAKTQGLEEIEKTRIEKKENKFGKVINIYEDYKSFL